MDYLTLALTPGVGPRRLLKILQAPNIHWQSQLEPEIATAYAQCQKQQRAQMELEKAHRLGLQIIGMWQSDYPACLLHLHEPPMLLYVQGHLPLHNRSVAIVGTRNASPWASGFAEQLAYELGQAGVSVISGLARGIDTAAHQGNLRAGANSLAVLGGSLDQIYPFENRLLAASLALVSEIPLGTRTVAGLFARRNRIIAALAQAVVVVEAGSQSGALITAQCALEIGRDVGAVPGRPTDSASRGCLRLLQDGAAVITSTADVLQLLGLPSIPQGPLLPTTDQLRLQDLFRLGEVLPEELATLWQVELQQALSWLSQMELWGAVKALPGGRYKVLRI